MRASLASPSSPTTPNRGFQICVPSPTGGSSHLKLLLVPSCVFIVISTQFSCLTWGNEAEHPAPLPDSHAHLSYSCLAKPPRILFLFGNFPTWSFLTTKVLAKGVMLEVTTVSASKASGRHVTECGGTQPCSCPQPPPQWGDPARATCEQPLWSLDTIAKPLYRYLPLQASR